MFDVFTCSCLAHSRILIQYEMSVQQTKRLSQNQSNWPPTLNAARFLTYLIRNLKPHSKTFHKLIPG